MKKYLKFVLIIVLLFTSLFAIYFIINTGGKSKYSHYEKIMQKIDDDKTFNLYLFNSDNNKNKELKYYKSAYDLSFVSFKANDNSKEYANLLNTLNIENITIPSFIVLKNGDVNTAFEINQENEFKEFLISNNLVDSKLSETDNIFLDDEFNELYNTDKEFNVLYGKDLYMIRKNLLKSNINYIVIDKNLSVNSEKILDDLLGDYTGNVLVKIKNKSIINKNENVSEVNALENIEKL